MKSNLDIIEDYSAKIESAKAGDEKAIRFLRADLNTPDPAMPDRLVVMLSEAKLAYRQEALGGRFQPRKKRKTK